MRQKLPKEARPGELIEAKEWNLLRQLVARNSVTGVGKGISMRRAADGTVIGIEAIRRYIGKTSSTITASDGTTAGTGTVDFYTIDITTGDFFDTGCSDTVWNISTTIGGIPSGTWVLIEEDMGGALLIWAVDCGN